MKHSKIETIIFAFKKLIEQGHYTFDIKLHLKERLDIISDLVKKENYDSALVNEAELNFSFYNEEQQAEKEFKYILRVEIIKEYIEYLKTSQKELNKAAIELIPDSFYKEEHTSNPLDIHYLISSEGEAILFINKIEEAQHVPLKHAVAHMLKLGLSKHKLAKNLAKEI